LRRQSLPESGVGKAYLSVFSDNHFDWNIHTLKEIWMKLNSKAEVSIDAGQWFGELPRIWNYIGYDECNYSYTPEGQELLAKFGAMAEKPYYVRVHHMFCTGNCHGFYKWGSTNVYLEDEQGNPVYDWTYIDHILDAILNNHTKPFFEMGFMPRDLVDASHYKPEEDGWFMEAYKRTGWACPPKDYQKWYDLVYNTVLHCMERYGLDEVLTWYWELWNEPDIFYWRGTVDEFEKLYDYTAAAVKAAHPQMRVGGPAVTNPDRAQKSGQFLDHFLNHTSSGVNYYTGQNGTPLDFITFHVKGGGYKADTSHAKLNPPSIQHLFGSTVTGYEILSKYPGYERLECILSECDPDGWAAGGAFDNINLNFRNTEYYASYVACSFDKLLKFSKAHQWDLKALTWAFMFVGERCFEGTRTFSTQGIDKAVMNLFRMYARLGSQQVQLTSTAAHDPLTYSDLWGFGVDADIDGVAALSGNHQLTALIYNHHDDWDVEGESEVKLTVAHLPFEGSAFTVKHYRVDATHSNAYPEWIRQGKPMFPTEGQMAAMKSRDGLELLEPPQTVRLVEGKLNLTFTMPVHSISLLVIELAA
jgi:xylan 1,4-beta-xylosidase